MLCYEIHIWKPIASFYVVHEVTLEKQSPRGNITISLWFECLSNQEITPNLKFAIL